MNAWGELGVPEQWFGNTAQDIKYLKQKNPQNE